MLSTEIRRSTLMLLRAKRQMMSWSSLGKQMDNSLAKSPGANLTTVAISSSHETVRRFKLAIDRKR